MIRFAAPAAALVFAFSAAAGPAAAAAADKSQNQCFFINQFESWRAPDDHTIYIRVNLHDYYRLDLASSCPELLYPDSHLITKTRGPDTVCSAIDWDLSVAQSGPGSFPVPCIVKSMRKLTPLEAAAIPKKFKP